jgi:hypothetical protein
MSDGHLHECRGRMPATALPPDFLELGWGVLAGDTLRPPGEDVELMALRDGATLGRAEDWQETRLRGFRGQKGERGDKGPRGPGLAGLSLLSDGAGGVAIMPRYDDPTIKAEPVALDMLTAEPEPGDAPIIGFAGPWKAARTYRRGAVVSAEHGGAVRLLLSVKPDNNAAPGDERAWRVML